MKRSLLWLLILVGCSGAEPPVPPAAAPGPAAGAPLLLDQGWSATDRATFYTTGQGSRLLPAAWFAALQRADGSGSFAADRLARFGYLPNGAAPLPIGFVEDPASGELGMTCAACHTGAVRFKGRTWRIDGGRANADFQAFLVELTAALRATLQPGRLDAFIAAVAGPGASPTAKAALEADFRRRVAEFGTFMDRSLPAEPWGPGRLDAFGMIFNRVTALDLGIPGNYRPADAPVRYPFLWNAPAQDATQWDGAAPNGNYVKALARNTGEVFGVFGRFAPKRIGLIVDYDNSVSFRNLHTLERHVARLRPPAWPRAEFGLDEALARRGAAVFDAACASCHAQQPSAKLASAWATPVCRVGTDPVMFRNALLTAQTGVLEGTPQLATGGLLGASEQKVSILSNAVIGSLLRDAIPINSGLKRAIRQDILDRNTAGHNAGPAPGRRWTPPAECQASTPPVPARNPGISALAAVARPTAAVASETAGLYQLPAGSRDRDDPAGAAYESRVLNGVWAAAPYLHNGSVPSLWQLLLPPGERAKSFPVGSAEFDPVDVGVSLDAPGPHRFDTGRPGNSNAGHAYGTTLPEPDRRALLEYLKTL